MKVEISKIAAIIPARKGSKRVRNKNLTIFGTKPLVLHTMEQAVKSNLTNIFFSTDYITEDITFKIPQGITWVSREKGISGDSAKANLYIRHFLNRYPEFEAVMLLQPTSPLRTTGDINRALMMYTESKNELLTSVCMLDSVSKLYQHKVSEKKVYSLSGEVELIHEPKPIYYRNGAIYMFSRKHFEAENSIFGSPTLFLEMPWMRSIDINTIDDIHQGQKMIKLNRRKIENVNITTINNGKSEC